MVTDLGVLMTIPCWKKKMMTTGGVECSALLVSTMVASHEEADSFWMDPDRFPGLQRQGNHVFPQADLNNAHSPKKLQSKPLISPLTTLTYRSYLLPSLFYSALLRRTVKQYLEAHPVTDDKSDATEATGEKVSRTTDTEDMFGSGSDDGSCVVISSPEASDFEPEEAAAHHRGSPATGTTLF